MDIMLIEFVIIVRITLKFNLIFKEIEAKHV